MRRIALIMFALFTATAQAEELAASAAAPPPAPKPAPELARLKPLEGVWACQGRAPAGALGPGSPEMKYTSTFTVKPAWDGFAYTMTYDQKKTKEHPMHFAGGWSIGWDGMQKKFVFSWLDNLGDVAMQTGTDWTADDFVVIGEGFGFGGHAAFRDTLTRTGDKAMHWKGEFKPQGAPAWITLGEDDCTKK